MSFYESLGDILSRRAGAFVAVIVALSFVMFMVAGSIDTGYEASGDPVGPAFEAREIITDEFPQTVHGIPFIIEAKQKDVLTQRVLAEFHANELEFKQSEIFENYRYEAYDVELDQPTEAMYTVADGVSDYLAGIFNVTLADATEDMVKVALHMFVADSPGIKASFSKDNRTEVRDITVNGPAGPMTFPNVKVWSTKALINVASLDYESFDADHPEGLDKEEVNLEVLAFFEGKGRSYNTYGIALDLQTEINKEAQTSVVLVVIAAIVILIIVAITLRSGRMTLLVGATILMLLFWIFGSIRLLNFGSSQFIDLLLPIAIISLGVDYALHSSHRYQEEKERTPDPREAYRRSVTRVGPALFIAMITTTVAFGSNATSDLETVSQFGIAAALAIVWAYLLLGLALPAMRMLPEARRYAKTTMGDGEDASGKNVDKKGPKVKGGRPIHKGRLDPLWTTVAKIGTRSPVVIIIVILITAPLAYRGWQIEGREPVEDYINEESDFVVGLDTMNSLFKVGEEGKVLLQGDFSDPENLRAINRFQENLKDNKEGIMGYGFGTPYHYVRNVTTNDFVFLQYDNQTLRDHLGIVDDDGDGLPDTRQMVEDLYVFIVDEDQGIPLYEEGPKTIRHPSGDLLSTFIWNKGDALDKVLLSVQIPRSGDASKVAIAREEVEADLAFLDEMGFDAGVVTSGEFYIVTDVGTYNPFTREEQMSALTESMASAILVSIVLCLIVLLVLFRSVKYAVAAIIPMTLVVAWLYGFMELTGSYLNSVTVTIAAISIGVGVDYSIHVTQRFREEHERYRDYTKAMHATMSTTGYALLGSAGSTFVGFMIIGFSPMTMFAKFGFLTAIMIGMAFIASIFVLPSFLYLASRNEGKDTEEHVD